jgi:hypothetical protein
MWCGRISLSRVSLALLALLLTFRSASSLDPEASRFYLHVADATGAWTDAADDVDLRPSDDAVTAYDMTYASGGMWWIAYGDLNNTDEYDVYVNGSQTAMQHLIIGPANAQNAVQSDDILADAVTGAKISEATQIALEPNASSGFDADLSVNNPAGGSAVTVAMGTANAQTGIAVTGIAGASSAGVSLAVGGSASGTTGLRVVDTSSGGSAEGIYVSASNADTTSAGVNVDGAGTRLVSVSSSGASAIGAKIVASDASGVALKAEHVGSGVAAQIQSAGGTGLQLIGSNATNTDVLLDVSGSGRMTLDPSLIDDDSFMRGTFADGDEEFLRIDLTSADDGADGILVDANGTGDNQTAITAVGRGDFSVGLAALKSTTQGIGLFASTGPTFTYPTLADYPAVYIEGDLASAITARIAHTGAKSALLVDDAYGGTRAATTGVVWATVDESNALTSAYRAGLDASGSASKGYRVDAPDGYTGDAFYVYHNGANTITGSGFQWDWGNTSAIYSGTGYIYHDGSSQSVGNSGPLVSITANQASGPMVDLSATNNGECLEVTAADGKNAIDVTNGIVNVTAGQINLPSGYESAAQGAAYYDGTTNSLFVYDTGSGWVHREASVDGSADTLYIPIDVYTDDWTGDITSYAVSDGRFNILDGDDADSGDLFLSFGRLLGRHTNNFEIHLALGWHDAAGTETAYVHRLNFGMILKSMTDVSSPSGYAAESKTITMSSTEYTTVEAVFDFTGVELSAASTDFSCYIVLERDENHADDTAAATTDTMIRGGYVKIW